jgi:hypothetical protein
MTVYSREYELLLEAQAKLSVVLNCSRFSLLVGCRFRLGCPAKLVSFRYNRNRNRKKFRNYPKQKDLFRFFRNIPKLECFDSFGSTKKELKKPKGGGKEGEGGREMEGKGKGKVKVREKVRGGG